GVSNMPAYLGLAAFSMALLAGIGLASLLTGVGRATFGHRQVGAALLILVVGGGLFLQATQAALGAWSIGGPGEIPAAYALVQAGQQPPGRVLWIGDPDGGSLVAPGGTPEGVAGAGASAVRFAVAYPVGATALDYGRPSAGPGYDALTRTIGEVFSGDTRHG